MRCGAALCRCVLAATWGRDWTLNTASLENKHYRLVMCQWVADRLCVAAFPIRRGVWDSPPGDPPFVGGRRAFGTLTSLRVVLSFARSPCTDSATLRHPPHVLVLASGGAMSPVGGPTGAVSLVAPPR
jgi:hypothetical protein